MKRKLPGILSAAIASRAWLLAVLPACAAAHHSYAMFDRDQTRNADAIVRIFEFTNPHATLWVYINDAQGKPVLWALEAPGPQQLLRSGWDKNTVKPGDQVKVALHPLRNGTHGGSLVSLTLSDGRSLGTGGPPPARESAPQAPAPAPAP